MARNRIFHASPVLAFALATAGAVPVHAAPNPNSAVITVPCGTTGGSDGSGACPKVNNGNGSKDGTTVEFYSGGILIYTEIDPTIYGGPGANKTSQVSILVTGNGKNFQSWYVDPTTSILNAPDIQVRILAGNKVVLFSKYSPVGSAIWAIHSTDAAGVKEDLGAEIARAKAAEGQLTADLAAEQAVRKAGDDGFMAALNAEVARAKAAELAIQTDIQMAVADETKNRIQGDADTLAAAKALSDAEAAARAASEAVLTNNLNTEIARAQAAETAETARAQMAEAAEAAARSAADAALMAGLNAEVAARNAAIAVETAARMAADATLDAAIMAESAARAAGDAAAKAYTDSRTPWPVSCGTGQVIVSTGANKWACNNLCAGTVSDPASDAKNCGGCGMACNLFQATSDCTNATCTIKACNMGWSNCDNQNANGCEAFTNFDSKNCGGCGKACNQGQICNMGVCGAPITCAGSNVILVTSPNQLVNVPTDCGTGSRYGGGGNYGFTWTDNTPGAPTAIKIEHQTGVICSNPNAARTTSLNGQAGDNFTMGPTHCDCSISNLQNNPPIVMNNISNRGAYQRGGANTFLITNAPATEGFAPNANMQNAYARITVTYGTNNVDVGSDPTNCGGCGMQCALPNSVPACSTGQCVLGQCNNGFGNCDNNGANGCETNFANDNANCGGCGKACGGGTPFCVNSACSASTHATNALTIDAGPSTIGCGDASAWRSQNLGQMTYDQCETQANKFGAMYVGAPNLGYAPNYLGFARWVGEAGANNGYITTGGWNVLSTVAKNTQQYCILGYANGNAFGNTSYNTSMKSDNGKNYLVRDLGVISEAACYTAALAAGARTLNPWMFQGNQASQTTAHMAENHNCHGSVEYTNVATYMADGAAAHTYRCFVGYNP